MFRRIVAAVALAVALASGVALVAEPADAGTHRPAATNGNANCLQADMSLITKDVANRLKALGWKGRTLVGGKSDGAERLYSPACPAQIPPGGIPGNALG